MQCKVWNDEKSMLFNKFFFNMENIIITLQSYLFGI